MVFGGHIDGNGYTIKGVPDNEFLIDYCVGGSIEDLTFDVGTNAAFLVFSPAAISINGTAYTYPFTMDGITVEGNVNLSSANQSNYSPFIYAAAPNFVMKNCTNYADITGVTYAAVFYGYSPYLGGNQTFDNCVNHGNVKLNNAALFFGNPTSFRNNSGITPAVNVTIEDCTNYGQIRSLATSANYFTTDVGSGLSDYSQTMEKALRSSAGLDTQSNTNMLQVGTSDKKCTDPKCRHQNDDTHDGLLYCGSEVKGLAVTVGSDGESILITKPTNDTNIAGYVVTVSSYANVFQTSYNENGSLLGNYLGTELVSRTESIMAANLSSYETSDNQFKANLKYYGIADEEIGSLDDETICGYAIRDCNGTKYYNLVHAPSITYATFNDTYVYAARDSFDENTNNFIGGAGGPHILSVSAINTSGQLVASAYYSGE